MPPIMAVTPLQETNDLLGANLNQGAGSRKEQGTIPGCNHECRSGIALRYFFAKNIGTEKAVTETG